MTGRIMGLRFVFLNRNWLRSPLIVDLIVAQSEILRLWQTSSECVAITATVNYQGKKYPLRITKVVPEVKDRMFDVDLVFTGEMPDNVRVGKSFRVQIELGQPEQAIVIPRGNFYQATGGQWIYKANASKTKAVRTPITIGRQNPQQYEITGGLEPGDYVVTTGYDTFGEAEELILK